MTTTTAETTTKLTRALNRGDRVRLPGGAIRTVSHVTPAGYLNHRNEPIQTVHYVEAPDGPSIAGTWSSTANTSAPMSEWTVVHDEDPRLYTLAREAQGFRSQAHLDAFYRSFDHGQTCEACQRPGPAAWVLDAWQPTRQQCPEGRRLFIESQEAK